MQHNLHNSKPIAYIVTVMFAFINVRLKLRIFVIKNWLSTVLRSLFI